MKFFIKILVLILVPLVARADPPYSVPHTFSAGDGAVASEVNENFNALVLAVNELSESIAQIQNNVATDPSGTYTFVGIITSTDYVEDERIGSSSFSGHGTIAVDEQGSCSGQITMDGFTSNINVDENGLASVDDGDGHSTGVKNVNFNFTCLASSVGGTFVARIILDDDAGGSYGIVVGVRQ